MAKPIDPNKGRSAKSQILDILPERTGVTRKQASAVIDTLSEVIEAHVMKNALGEFVLPGLLKISTVRKLSVKARKGISPFTNPRYAATGPAIGSFNGLHAKSAFLAILGLMLCFTGIVSTHLAAQQETTWIVELDNPSEDLVPVVSFDVTKRPYSADPTGMKDSTKAFSQALADAKVRGGTVFAPSGRYRIEGTLTIPIGVTLRGDWKKPFVPSQGTKQTLLMAYSGRGSTENEPFITVKQGAVRDLSIFYPEQSLADIAPYPVTVLLDSDAVAQNITLVNSYRGVQTGSFSTIIDLYGTTLDTGITMLYAYAVPRCRRIHLSPRYWTESGITGVPSNADISHALKQRKAIGIQLNRQDAGIFVDTVIEDYHTGVKAMPPHGWTFWHNMKIRNAEVGIHFTGGLDHKMHATQCEISANQFGILMQADRTGWQDDWKRYLHPNRKDAVYGTKRDSGFLRFFDCKISSKGTGIYLDGSFEQKINLQECAFLDWSSDSNHAAVVAKGGEIIIYDSEFNESGNHLIADNNSMIELVGNQFSGGPNLIVPKSSDQVTIDHSIVRDVSRSMKPIIRVPDMLPARTGRDSLYIATEAPFDASNDGESDASAGIQQALDQAGSDGGGTVFLPQGRYRLTRHLTVPPGVELRGVNDFMPRAQQLRTLIVADIPADRDKPENPPLISLQSSDSLGGSGVAGMAFWYPHQDFRKISAYPWTIRSLGPGCWVQRVYLGNCYNAVDFGTYNSDRHVISRVTGSALNTAFFVANSETIGWIDNCHIRPQDWALSSQTGGRQREDYVFEIPGDRYSKPTIDDIFRGTEYSLIPNMRGAAAITVGSGANEQITGFFTNGATRAFDFIDHDGTGGGNANILIGGSEAGWGAWIHELGRLGITMVNFSFSAMTRFPYVTDKDIPEGQLPKALVMRIEPTVGNGQFNMIMGKFYGRGDVDTGVDMQGGDVYFKQGITVIGFNEAVVNAQGGRFRQRNNHMGPVIGESK